MGPTAAKFNAAILFGPAILGILIALDFKIQVFAIFLVGFFLFITAKISVFRKGEYVSFGSKAMTAKMRKYYYGGYVLMAPAGVFSVLLALAGPNFSIVH